MVVVSAKVSERGRSALAVEAERQGCTPSEILRRYVEGLDTAGAAAPPAPRAPGGEAWGGTALATESAEWSGPRCAEAEDGQHRLREVGSPGAPSVERRAADAGYFVVCTYCGELYTAEELDRLPTVLDADPDCNGGRHVWERLAPRRTQSGPPYVTCRRCGMDGR